MVREVYDRLIAVSALWHASGVASPAEGPVPGDALVGTPFMRILDHLTLALGCGREFVGSSERVLVMMLLMWGAASWRKWGVALGPLVTTRLPLAVHLMVASLTYGGEIAWRPWLRAWQRWSGFTWFFWLMPSDAKSTTRLGLGGLASAIAMKVWVVGLGGGPEVQALWLLAFCCGLGVGADLSVSMAFASWVRVSWIFLSSRALEGGGGVGEELGFCPAPKCLWWGGCEGMLRGGASRLQLCCQVWSFLHFWEYNWRSKWEKGWNLWAKDLWESSTWWW